MAKKKKKMTKAQAASARRDDYVKKDRDSVVIDDKGPKDKNSVLTLVVPLVFIGVVVLISAYFVYIPGLMG